MSESPLNSEVFDDLDRKSRCSSLESESGWVYFVMVNIEFVVFALRQKSHLSLELWVRLSQPSQGWDDVVYSQAEPKPSLKGQTSPGEVGVCHNAELNEGRLLSVYSGVFAVTTQALLSERICNCEVWKARGAGWTAAGTTISFTVPLKGVIFVDISPNPLPSLFPWVESGLVKVSVATTLSPRMAVLLEGATAY